MKVNIHNHGEHAAQVGHRRLRLALGLVIAIMAFEVAGGIVSNSLALLGDAGHMLVDALALGLSLFAMTMAKRPPTREKTFGYHRMEIMAALANGTFLILVSVYIFYEAYHRFLNPPSINTPVMLLVAAIGLAANLAGLMLLRGVSHGNLNIKAALWHIIGDTISSVGVILAGVVIIITGWQFADPVIAVFIGCIILWGAVRIVREAADILLEAVPKNIHVGDVITAVKEVAGVNDIHDVHIWTITSGIHALSAHVVIQDQMVSNSAEIVRTITNCLSQQFDIGHTTLQLECESCPTGLICELSQSGAESD